MKKIVFTISLLYTLQVFGHGVKTYETEANQITTPTPYEVKTNTIQNVEKLTQIEQEINRLNNLLSNLVVTYPDCHSFIMAHDMNTPVPSGYRNQHSQDLMWTYKNNYDDFRLFVSLNAIPPGKPAKCYVNHIVSGREPYGETAQRKLFGNDQFLVPKGVQGHLLSSPEYYCGQQLFITVTELYTNKVIYTELPVPKKTDISLPFSNEENQLFQIQIKRTWQNPVDHYYLCCPHARNIKSHHCAVDRINNDARGAILFYVDHITLDTEKRDRILKQIEQLQNEYHHLEEIVVLDDLDF